jgi:hypothetical protein
VTRRLAPILVYRSPAGHGWVVVCRIHRTRQPGHHTHADALDAARTHCWQYAPWLRPAPGPTGLYA